MLDIVIRFRNHRTISDILDKKRWQQKVDIRQAQIGDRLFLRCVENDWVVMASICGIGGPDLEEEWAEGKGWTSPVYHLSDIRVEHLSTLPVLLQTELRKRGARHHFYLGQRTPREG